MTEVLVNAMKTLELLKYLADNDTKIEKVELAHMTYIQLSNTLDMVRHTLEFEENKSKKLEIGIEDVL